MWLGTNKRVLTHFLEFRLNVTQSYVEKGRADGGFQSSMSNQISFFFFLLLTHFTLTCSEIRYDQWAGTGLSQTLENAYLEDFKVGATPYGRNNVEEGAGGCLEKNQLYIKLKFPEELIERAESKRLIHCKVYWGGKKKGRKKRWHTSIK